MTVGSDTESETRWGTESGDDSGSSDDTGSNDDTGSSEVSGEVTSENPSDTTELASWSARAAAFAVDVLSVLLVAAVLVMTVAQFDGPWWAYAAVVTAALAVIAVNRW